MKETSKQITSSNIEALQFYQEVFYQPLEQHYYFYLYNRAHDYEEAVERAKASYLPLNEANLKLGRFCKACILDFKSGGFDEASDERKADLLQESLDKWQRVYIAGNVFSTLKFAKHIMEGLESYDYPIRERLNQHDDLIRSFINIPPTVKTFFQISMHIAERDFFPFMEALIKRLREDPHLAYYVAEVHISEKSTVVEFPDGRASYRTVKVGLLPTIVNSRKNPLIKELLAAILPLVRTHREVDIQFNPYAVKLGKNTFLSQGNSNYKKFLNLLGVLDKVYLSNHSYAYHSGTC